MKKLVLFAVALTAASFIWAQAPQTVGTDYVRKPVHFVVDGKNYVNSDVFFKLESIDEETGLRFTEFAIDGGEFMRYTSRFHLLENGPREIAYRAYDNSSNMEIAKTFNVTVDNIPPVAELETDVPLYTKGLTRFCSPATKWSVNASDNAGGAGLAAVYMGTSVDSVEVRSVTKDSEDAFYTLPIEGVTELYFSAIDNVDNLTPIALTTVTVDATPPEVFIENNNRLINKNGTYTVFPSTQVIDEEGRIIVSSVEAVAFGAKDALSGVDAIYLKINDGEYTKYIEPIKFAESDVYNIEVKAIDNVGNESAPVAYTFFVDKASPDSVLDLVDENGQDVPATTLVEDASVNTTTDTSNEN